MKKTIAVLIIVFAFPLLFSCSSSEGGEEVNEFEMKAVVTALGDKIEVDVVEAEYASGIYWVITSESTVFKDLDGNKIERSDIAVGDQIIIGYNGQVMMSYPPQVAATVIKKCNK